MSGQSAESGDTPTLVPIENAEAMRDYLDALNDAGIDCRAVGMDSRGEPFLISLSGCYADSEVVLYGNPWDNEVVSPHEHRRPARTNVRVACRESCPPPARRPGDP